MSANASADLAAIAARLRATGERGLKLQLSRGLRAGAAPLTTAVKNAALAQLPKSGGLNRQVAGQKVSVSVLLSARTAAVRLKTTAPDTKQTDSGYVRHPTFGRRGRGDWKTQQIPQASGWWSKTLERESPEVTPALIAVMRTVSAELEGL